MSTLNTLVISRKKNLRDTHSPILCGSRVLFVLEQPCFIETLLQFRPAVPECVINFSGHCVYQNRGSDFTAGEHVITYGNLLVHERIDHTLIDALVMPTDERHYGAK